MASDLISKAAAIECMKSMAGCDACNNYGGARCRACTWDDAMDIVDELPAVDATPVVHAKWILIQNGLGVCSACNRSDHIDSLAAYCRYCGARMDGGDGNTTN